MGLVRPDCPGDTSCEEALSFNQGETLELRIEHSVRAVVVAEVFE